MSTEVQSFTGIVEAMPIEEYHSSPGLSFTGFKRFHRRSPQHYRAYVDMPQEQTDSQKLGSLTHLAVLEPELFAKTVIHIAGPMNKNPYKAQKDEAEAAGLIACGDSMYRDVIGMRDSVLKHPEISSLLRVAQKEVSAFWIDPEHDVVLRCRPDVWEPKSGIIADLKTVGDASSEGFTRLQLIRNDYHLQSAFYLAGMSMLTGRKLNKFVHICVETDYPHGVMAHALDDASLERADLDIRHGLARYAHCLKTDTWPGLPTGINTVALPSWAWGDGEVSV